MGVNSKPGLKEEFAQTKLVKKNDLSRKKEISAHFQKEKAGTRPYCVQNSMFKNLKLKQYLKKKKRMFGKHSYLFRKHGYIQ